MGDQAHRRPASAVKGIPQGRLKAHHCRATSCLAHQSARPERGSLRRGRPQARNRSSRAAFSPTGAPARWVDSSGSCRRYRSSESRRRAGASAQVYPASGRIGAGRPDRKIVFSAGGRWEASCPRSNRSRAGTSDCRGRPFCRILLDKIRNLPYVFLMTESLPVRRRPGPGEEKFAAV
jgi:hypothetical protein